MPLAGLTSSALLHSEGLGGPVVGGFADTKALRLAYGERALQRTLETATDAKIATYSFFITTGDVLASFLFGGFVLSDTCVFVGDLGGGDIRPYYLKGGGATVLVTTTNTLSANTEYHIVIQVDTTQATAANRVRILVDGADDTDGSGTFPALNDLEDYTSATDIESIASEAGNLTHIESGGGNTTNGGNVTVNYSTTLLQNDFVVVWGGYPGTAGDAGVSTSGFSEPVDNQAATPSFSVSYKQMGATPDASFTGTGDGVATSGVAYKYAAFRNVDTSTPLDGVTPAVAGPTASTNPDPASISVGTAYAAVLIGAITTANDATWTLPASPGTWANTGTTQVGNDNNDVSVNGAYQLNMAAGACDPASWTNVSTGTWKAFTMSLRRQDPPATGRFIKVNDVVRIDGTVYGAASFASGGNPIDASGLTFGNRGSYLKFETGVGSTAGEDSSPNNNDWTSTMVDADFVAA